MMLLEFLNQNSGAFAVIFSAVVAIATTVYAILTWILVSETRKMRQAQTEPKVSINIQPREEWINLTDMVIQNTGFGPAYDIDFEMSPDFEYAKGRFLSDLGFMKNGLKYLAPSQKLQFFLTSMVENFEEKTQTPFEIKVTYQNSVGKTYEDVYLIDFSELVGLLQLGEPPLHKIAKNIENIRKDIGHLSTGFHRLKVIVYTMKDIQEETKQRLEQANRSNEEDGQ